MPIVIFHLLRNFKLARSHKKRPECLSVFVASVLFAYCLLANLYTTFQSSISKR
uniref:Uncharacterized protein n=1 Tax=Tetranychus urticae TaxID=32264 RepID=T1KZU9_TETUR